MLHSLSGRAIRRRQNTAFCGSAQIRSWRAFGCGHGLGSIKHRISARRATAQRWRDSPAAGRPPSISDAGAGACATPPPLHLLQAQRGRTVSITTEQRRHDVEPLAAVLSDHPLSRRSRTSTRSYPSRSPARCAQDGREPYPGVSRGPVGRQRESGPCAGEGRSPVRARRGVAGGGLQDRLGGWCRGARRTQGATQSLLGQPRRGCPTLRWSPTPPSPTA